MSNIILKSNSTFFAAGNTTTGWTTSTESGSFLHLVQSSNISISAERKALKQLNNDVSGNMLVCDDVFNAPDVNLSIDYYFSPYLKNETIFGLSNNASGFFQLLQDRNQNIYQIIDDGNGRDALNQFKDKTFNYNEMYAIGIGNCFLTDYSISFKLDRPALVNTKFVGSNIKFDKLTGNTLQIPAINFISGNSDNAGYLDVKSIQSGNLTPISVYKPSLSKFYIEPTVINPVSPGINISGGYSIIQSMDLSLSLDRQAMYGLGSNYVYGRKLAFPCDGNLSFSALVSGIETNRITGFLFSDDTYTAVIEYKDPKTTGVSFSFNNLKLNSFNYSLGVNGIVEISCSFNFKAKKLNDFFMYTIHPSDY